jgi:hypothetical protein
VVFLRNGVKEDIFGPVDDNFDGLDAINFRFGPDEDRDIWTISTRLVREVRESKFPEKAMRAFRTAAFALVSNPFPSVTRIEQSVSACRQWPFYGRPDMDVHLGIRDDPDGDEFFLYSCLAGTCIAVDYETALVNANRDTYITPGLCIRPPHRYLNPQGSNVIYRVSREKIIGGIQLMQTLLEQGKGEALKPRPRDELLTFRAGEMVERVYRDYGYYSHNVRGHIIADPALFNVNPDNLKAWIQRGDLSRHSADQLQPLNQDLIGEKAGPNHGSSQSSVPEPAEANTKTALKEAVMSVVRYLQLESAKAGDKIIDRAAAKVENKFNARLESLDKEVARLTKENDDLRARLSKLEERFANPPEFFPLDLLPFTAAPPRKSATQKRTIKEDSGDLTTPVAKRVATQGARGAADAPRKGRKD